MGFREGFVSIFWSLDHRSLDKNIFNQKVVLINQIFINIEFQ